jgi:cytosine/adenosine deaminase-related metal-dependent hydrolase
MATADGARTLGLDGRDRLDRVGKRADLIVVGRMARIRRRRTIPYATLVYSTSASDVRTTSSTGRVLVDQGELTGLDLARSGRSGRPTGRQLAERAGVV